ncbi:hypothetical protein RR11_281 [Ruegeria sp. R11]|nr:hypothetical protein RR11_281 [Ruegeria sp. R11]
MVFSASVSGTAQVWPVLLALPDLGKPNTARGNRCAKQKPGGMAGL